MNKLMINFRKRLPRGLPTLSWLSLLTAWLVTFAALAAGFDVLPLPIFLALFAVAAGLALGRANEIPSPRQWIDAPAAVIISLSVYLCLTAAWTPSIAAPCLKGGLVMLCMFAVMLAKWHYAAADRLRFHQAARGITIGLAIALSYLAIEYLSDFALVNFVAAHWPGEITTRFNGRTVVDFYLNKAVSASMLLLWPVQLTVWYWVVPGWRAVVAVYFFLMTILVLSFTASQTAQVAFLLGGTAFALASFAPHLVRRLAYTVWSIVVICIVPIVLLLHWFGLQNATYLPFSFRDRVAIWHATALQVGDHFWFGVGVRADRYGTLHSDASRTTVERLTEDHLGWHSHNLFLQVWHELGAVGVVFLLMLGLLLIRRISDLASPVQPFVYATFASFCGVAAFGYGAWQSWLLASYAWAVIFLLIGNEAYRRTVAR